MIGWCWVATMAQGTLDLPAEGPIAVNLTGATLDLAPRLARRTPRNATARPSAAAGSQQPAGPPWIAGCEVRPRADGAGQRCEWRGGACRNDGGVIQTIAHRGPHRRAGTIPCADRRRARRAPPHRQRGRRWRAAARPGLCPQHAGREAVGAGAVRRCAAGPAAGRDREHRAVPHPRCAGVRQAAAGDDAVWSGGGDAGPWPGLHPAGGTVPADRQRARAEPTRGRSARRWG